MGDWGSNPGRVIPTTQKMLLDTALLNTQHYKVCNKSKGQSRTHPRLILVAIDKENPQLELPILLKYVIYSYNIYHHHHQVRLLARISLTVCFHSSLSSIAPASSPDYILCLHKAVVCKFLWIYQHWHTHVEGSIKECHL